MQRCSCGRADGIDWGVASDVWAKVGASGVLCLPCFDALAEQAGVDYKLTHLYYVSERGIGPDFTEVDRDRHEWIGKAHDYRAEIERIEANRQQIILARDAYRAELDEERQRRIEYQAEAERLRPVITAVNSAVYHDHTDTGTCPDCDGADGMCARSADLWHEVYVAVEALREAFP